MGKISKTRRKAEPTPVVTWQYYAKIIAVAAAGLSGVIFIYNSTVPTLEKINDSGPMPYAGRSEVDALRADGTKKFENLDESIQQTLETAKAALAAAEDAKQQSNENRKKRLLEQNADLRAQLLVSPGNRTLQDVIERNEIELKKMLDEMRSR